MSGVKLLAVEWQNQTIESDDDSSGATLPFVQLESSLYRSVYHDKGTFVTSYPAADTSAEAVPSTLSGD